MSMFSRLIEISQENEGAPKIALGYLGVLTLAEMLTVLYDPRLGLILHGLLLVALLFHAARSWEKPIHGLLLTLIFAPLVRLFSLSLPLQGIPVVYWYLITSVPLFVTALIAIRNLGFSRADVGLKLGALPTQLLIALSGLVLGYIEYRILQPEPLAEALTLQQLWLPALILLIGTGFMEELLFRGVLQRVATESLGLPDARANVNDSNS